MASFISEPTPKRPPGQGPTVAKARPSRRFSAQRIERELRGRCLPHAPDVEPTTWLEVLREESGRHGAQWRNALQSRRAEDAAARHATWNRLSLAGFSFSSIAAAWGADHTTVRAAIVKLDAALGLGLFQRAPRRVKA